MPTGVFGHFMNWASLDWLGASPFSQGGGFFPVKNKDDTSTVIFAPINQTGVHSLLIHSTLFDGKEITEPITIAGKFSTLTADQNPPEIVLEQKRFVNSNDVIIPEIIEDNLSSVTYMLDGNLIQLETLGIDISSLDDGSHTLVITAIDKFGSQTSETFEFIVDKTSPTLELITQNNTAVSNRLDIQVNISDNNLPRSDYLSYLLPNGERIIDKESYSFDTSELDEGKYSIDIMLKDEAENTVNSKLFFEIDNTIIDPEKSPITVSSSQASDDYLNYLLIIILGIAAIAIVSVFVIFKQKSKIPQKN